MDDNLSLGTHLSSLPSDLGRLILESAAIMDFKTAVNWTLVSKPIQIWMEPIMYHTVIITKEKQVEPFMSAVLARTTRKALPVKVFICGIYTFNKKQLSTVLCRCKSIVSLSYTSIEVWMQPEIHSLVNGLPSLKRIYPFNPYDFTLTYSNHNLTHFCYKLRIRERRSFYLLREALSANLGLTHILLNIHYVVDQDPPFPIPLSDLLSPLMSTLEVIVLNFLQKPCCLPQQDLNKIVEEVHYLRPQAEVVFLHLDCERGFYPKPGNEITLPPPKCYLPSQRFERLKDDEEDVWSFVDKLVKERPASCRKHPEIVDASSTRFWCPVSTSNETSSV